MRKIGQASDSADFYSTLHISHSSVVSLLPIEVSEDQIEDPEMKRNLRYTASLKIKHLWKVFKWLDTHLAEFFHLDNAILSFGADLPGIVHCISIRISTCEIP